MSTEASSTSLISDCPHLPHAVGFLSQRDFEKLLSVLHCDDCGRNRSKSSAESNLWLCLYPDCFMLGCSEGPDHSSKHYENYPEHCVQLNVDTRRIWCYRCNDEVRVRQQSNRFGALIRPPAGGSYEASAEGTENSNRRQRRKRPPGSVARGLVGLSNLGNTCYMNSALQCLLNTPTLTEYFLTCPALVANAERNAMSRSFKKLVDDIWGPRGDDSPYVAPANVLYAVKTAYPMFRGFHQHDSQEFLRCFMDLMHEELMEPTIELDEHNDSDNLDSVSEVGSGSDVANEDMDRGEAVTGDEEDEGDGEYETADSGVSEQSSNGDEDGGGREGRRMEVDGVPDDSGGADSPDDFRTPPMAASPPKSPSRAPQSTVQPLLKGISVIRKRRPKTYRSVISDIFDGKLVSSVQCLTCDRVSKTTETFQDLSLPIPTLDTLSEVRNPAAASSSSEGWVSWAWTWLASWFYGPTITLNDCLSAFFSADELKGDNMYSCERCKKLRNGLKYSRVTVLPDTLCVHLKRFRHDFAFSSKISSRVTFPLVDLDMTPWLHKESTSAVSLYDLTGVICHHGSAGGGHYTSYALNPIDEDWYEFDDSTVTKVDPATVMSSEAYVLFYRKSGAANEAVRERAQSLLAQSSEAPSLVQFWVSRQWMNKFETFAEPGPIDNSDFLCHHGGVLPTRTDYVYELCVALPQSLWDHLHSTFGGGPACTRLYECANCRAELDALTRQKKFELEEFKTLHQEFQEQETPSAIFCLSSSWFKVWEGFVTGRKREPPGPIDNRAIIVSSSSGSAEGKQQQQPTLRQGSDYLQVSHDIWLLFSSIYGGGPEVVVRPNGTVHISGVNGGNAGGSSPSSGSPVAAPTLPALSTRLRARSASTCEAAPPPLTESSSPPTERAKSMARPGYVTRSKSSKSESLMEQD